MYLTHTHTHTTLSLKQREMRDQTLDLRSLSTWSDPVPLVLPEALQSVHANLQPIGHHAQLHGTVTHICDGKHSNLPTSKNTS